LILARIRSALFFCWMVAVMIPIAIAVLVASLFVRGEPLYWMCVSFLRLSIVGARWICGVRWRVQGMEHLPKAGGTEPVILVPKHQSTWETFAFPTMMPHPLAYVFKRELLWIPFFGWAMGRLDMVHIDRSNRHEAWSRVAEQGRRLMAQGIWVIMFPEGTRTPRGSQGVYKAGASRLAVATGASLVPIAVTSARCWPRKSFVLRPGLIEVSIGAPIRSAGRDPDSLMREVESWVEGEMRRLDPQAYAT
jgi:1-acyl-sn-glycerol-3-phosphate acyltransferase